jgi:protein-disulfide isomerase/uncharacterized membrane protein
MDILRRQGFFLAAAALILTSITVTTGANQAYALIPQLAAALAVCAGLVLRDTLTGTLATAVVAFGANAYLFNHKLEASAGKLLCDIDATFSCGKINSSEWSMAFGVPITLIGMAFYSGLFLAGMMAPSGPAKNAVYPRINALFAIGSTVYSMFLLKVSHDMGSYCLMCLTIYGANFLLVWSGFRGVREAGSTLLADVGTTLQSRELIVLCATFLVAVGGGRSYFLDQTKEMRALTQKPAEKAKTPEDEERELIAKLYAQAGGPVEVTGTEPSQGPADAKYQLVEFADFGCPHCAEASEEVKDLLAAWPDLQIKYKYFPLSPACNPMIAAVSGQQDPDPGRCRAAYAAECAHQQGKFWEMSHELFHNQGPFPQEQLKDLAKGVGLDVPKWEECLANPNTAATVEASARAGEAAGVRGTPSLFLKGVFPNQVVDVSFGMLGVAKLLELHQDGKPLPAPPPPHKD